MSKATHTSYVKSGLRRALTLNAPTSYSPDDGGNPLTPKTTEPTIVDSGGVDAVFAVRAGNAITIFPFGEGADNQTFAIRVYLWRKIAKSGTQTADLWIPYFAGEISCVMSAALNGVAGAPLLAGELFCDTITQVTTTWDTNIVLARSYENDQLASFDVTTIGFDYVQLEFDSNGGLDPSGLANACYAIR